MIGIIRILFIPISIVLFVSCAYQDREVDMIVHNAVIYTVDNEFSIAEAMAIDSGKVIDIGPENEIRNRYKTARRVNAAGKYVYPGFIDSHCHFVGYGLEADQVDLYGTKSWEECVERIKAYVETSSGYWIQGAGWDQNDWDVKKFPDNKELNRLFPDQPIIVDRIDGHAAIANDQALSIAHVDRFTQVEGGEVVLDSGGRLTGLLIDNAKELVKQVIPEPDESELRSAILRAQADCFATGLTTVDDAGLDTTVVNIIDGMHDSGELKMRVYAMLEATDAGKEYMKKGKVLKDRLTVRSIKLYGDGALGSRGAALKSDYHDHEGNKGSLIHRPMFYRQWAALCDLYDFQMNTHCIGDRANQILLKIYEEQLEGTNDERWRIEHAQVITEDDMSLFGEFNVLPSVQPMHATSDMPWAEERLGDERIEGSYAYASLLIENGLLLLGTDFPVERIDPLHTFYAAVFRKDTDGIPIGGWRIEEALTREQALMGMTIWGAIGNFEEERKGSLEVGKMADFVILDQDIMTAAEKNILSTKVIGTYVDGEKVY